MLCYVMLYVGIGNVLVRFQVISPVKWLSYMTWTVAFWS